MKHHFSSAALLVSLAATACTGHAAPTRTVSIEKAADQATSIETRQATGAGAKPDLFTTHYYAGGAMLMAWADQQVLLLCKKSAYLNLPGMKPAAIDLPLEKRQMVGYQAMMAGYGGIVSIVLKGGFEAAKRFCEKTELFTLAESLGGVESLVNHPAVMTHASIPVARREQLGISDALVRLSVGVEELGDLQVDLERALAPVGGTSRNGR